MIRVFIIFFCFASLSIQAAKPSLEIPVKPEDRTDVQKTDKPKANTNRKKDSQIKAQEPTELAEDYRPSLTESLNDSNSLKTQIKRQLSGDNKEPANAEEKPSSKEVANFGNISVGISKRKKEENLREVYRKN